MCRYGDSIYKDHYACFKCRKSFKKPFITRDVIVKKLNDSSYSCPQCKSKMHSMGLDFKTPKQNDIKQWQKVEILYQNGFTYHSCGCCGPGLRPAELDQIADFLSDKLEKSEGENYCY